MIENKILEICKFKIEGEQYNLYMANVTFKMK